MQPVATAMTLIIWCAACAMVKQTPPSSQLVEAQKLFEEGQKLREAGKYAEAVTLVERVLALREPVLGRMHLEVASYLNLLGDLHRLQGRYMSAEPLIERALAIREAALGKNHPQVAASLNNLANLYLKQGLYAWAEPLYERALAIREAALGNNHPQVADSLNNLAVLYKAQGLYARAGPLYERALSIRQAALGQNHPDVGASLNNLADLYLNQGLLAQAEPLYERALVIREAALGENHPDFASSLYNLAVLYMEQGLYARAEPPYDRALAIREATLGKNHPDLARSLPNLARLRLAQQNLVEALPLLARAFAATEEHLRQEVFSFSETRLTSLLHLLREDEELLYALVRAHPDDARARHLALSAALLRKGRSAKEIADTSRIIFHSLGQADHAAFERLRALRTQLSALSLSSPGSLSSADYQQRLKEVAAETNALEEDLSRRAAPLRALSALPPPDEVIDQVAKALPKDGALIEFVAYRDSPLVPSLGISPAQSPRQLRYLALLLFADGRTHALDLGPAEPIDGSALRLYDALAGHAVSYEPAAQALYKLAFRPLRPHLDQVKSLFISPDGQLAQTPFAALHDGRHFLVDAMDIIYLTSGKDLLPRHEGIAPARSVVVLADPNFNSLPATPHSAPPAAPTFDERPAFLERFFSTNLEPVADQPWPPLPGARKEAEAIQGLLPHAQILLGPAATKEALLSLDTPGILHIATHGFFLEDDSTSAEARAVQSFGVLGDTGPQGLPDPLLRSGLVLAGTHASARQPGLPGREDSLITALELAGLNLWGTQLVVLSACDTGRGHVELGQGVHGLRRALMIAGAESLVTSLWKVNDETTRELMEGYYRNLVEGHGRTAALNRAMRDLRRRQPHPHFWAPFIPIGKNAPLQGLVPSDLARPVP